MEVAGKVQRTLRVVRPRPAGWGGAPVGRVAAETLSEPGAVWMAASGVRLPIGMPASMRRSMRARLGPGVSVGVVAAGPSAARASATVIPQTILPQPAGLGDWHQAALAAIRNSGRVLRMKYA